MPHLRVNGGSPNDGEHNTPDLAAVTHSKKSAVEVTHKRPIHEGTSEGASPAKVHEQFTVYADPLSRKLPHLLSQHGRITVREDRRLVYADHGPDRTWEERHHKAAQCATVEEWMSARVIVQSPPQVSEFA